MTDVTVHWYRFILQQHHARLKQLFRFYDRIALPSEHREAFRELIREIEGVFNAAYVDELNKQLEARKKNANHDELPF